MKLSPAQRHQEAFEIWRRWDRWSGRLGAVAERKTDESLAELTTYFALDFAAILRELGKADEVSPTDADALLSQVVLQAAQTLREEPGRDLPQYVKRCIRETLRDLEASSSPMEQATEQQLDGKALMARLLKMPHLEAVFAKVRAYSSNAT
jgi:hypothetical protein